MINNYQIQNSKFTTIYNSLSIFDKVVFHKANTTTHEYSGTLNLWQKVLKLKNNILYRLYNEFGIDNSIMINTINNIINHNLTNIKATNYFLTINDDKKSLKQWNETLSLPQGHCLYMLYMFGESTLKKIIISLYNAQPSNIKPVNTEKITINFCETGTLLTYRNITNNLSGWQKILNHNLYYIKTMLANNQLEYLFHDMLIKPRISNIFEINGIYASYENWSLFINKHKSYLEDMIHSMGYNYTRNYLYNTIVNNTDFITQHTEITIDNQSLSIYQWSKKIKKSASYLYNLRTKYGIEYVIKYICERLK